MRFFFDEEAHVPRVLENYLTKKKDGTLHLLVY
jgi:hypothetical protein